MPSSTANQSYNYIYTNTSGGSTYTGGQAASTSTMLNQWATTQDRTERFYVTGQRTGHGVWEGMDKTMAFDRDFNRTK
ncbi:hypothetical protein ACKRZS_000092 [Fusarium odoratissimum]|uniref:Uncharacterized protein n=3 Tax=Fusarium oxysporum species complex TaxID=171631 RepID=N1RG25_FUSC4|nr:uncharacterized protein FOIG_00195 [Fusarium odoratissimum NRRL 54006]EMT64649.1 hypothetical protein FOC4_g10007329 [Fusarium odoratissimum]KAH7217966.1 hypothetical protein DER44DRAFT_755277 [Fusarium oxysporum]KAK2137699.1 hypothetical protein NOF04DRAFT_236 [Fusarium oxysporum II5]TXC04083.1 hypothetical protein FocTR4_00001947 [Fusarium oxysporum f. sp. cubense]EXM09883.1 hypothetical protein FOIG_00195 [Fusarium odoratissimum NRRL 54006]